MSDKLTGGGGVGLWMVLGMIAGIIFDSRSGGDDHRGLVLGLVFGLAAGVMVTALRRARAQGPR